MVPPQVFRLSYFLQKAACTFEEKDFLQGEVQNAFGRNGGCFFLIGK